MLELGSFGQCCVVRVLISFMGILISFMGFAMDLICT
jgi:hypothetical protein